MLRTTTRAGGVLVAAALLVLSACGSSSDGSGGSDASAGSTDATTTTAASTDDPGGDLLVVTATGGTLADGTLELTGVDSTATVFTDRPKRSAEREELSTVADDWASFGFDEDPPNAALVTRGPDGQVTTVVELGAPTVSGDAISFPAKQIEAGSADGVTARLPSDDQPDELVQPSLFIDSGSAGTFVSIEITGTFGAGVTKAALDGWYFSNDGPTSMGFQMGEPGTIQFDTYEEFFSLTTPAPITGTFSGVGLIQETSLVGHAVVPDGSDLTINLCGANGSTTPFVQNTMYDIPIPESC